MNVESDIEENIDELIKDETQENLEDTDQTDPPNVKKYFKKYFFVIILTVLRQVELVEKVKSYDPYVEEELLNKAYVYSMKAHGSQKRASGAPYFSHPLEVAGILADYKFDSKTIITALLHDVVEDTNTDLRDIKVNFGKKFLI